MVLSAFAFIFVFVSLLLGLIMYFTGCNPYIEGQCFSHHVVKATVVGYSYSNGTRYGCEGEACVPAVIPCYHSALLMHEKGDDVCLRSVAHCAPSFADARKRAAAHAIGEHMVLNARFDPQHAAECGSRRVELDRWVGLALLTASGSMCAALIGGWLLMQWQQRRQQQHYDLVSRNDDPPNAEIELI